MARLLCLPRTPVGTSVYAVFPGSPFPCRNPRRCPVLTPAEQAYEGRPSPFAPPTPQPWVDRVFPLIPTLRNYSGGAFRLDAIAGLTVAALAIPSALGFASIAGLPVQYGLYALVLPVLAYALLGSAPRLVIGPEGTTAAMIAAALTPLAVRESPEYVQLAAALAVLVGVIFLLARLARVGAVVDFMSVPVLVGYITGVAIFLIVGQLEKLTGIPSDSDTVTGQLADFLSGLGDIHPLTAVIGAVCVVLLVAAKRVPKLPAALVVVVVSIALSAALDFAARGVKTTGEVPSGLPVPAVPWEGLASMGSLIVPAVGIFFVAFSDSILTARSFAARHGESVDANAELVAFGGAQLAAGVGGGFPVSTSGSRTSVNDASGATSQVSQLVAAAAVILVLLFLTGPIAYLPSPVLGAIIVVAAASLISISDWRELKRSSTAEVAIAAVTTLGVVFVGVIQALIIAMLLSLIDMARRRALAHDAVEGWWAPEQRFADIEVQPQAEVIDGVVLYRFDASLFYANANRFKERCAAAVAGAPYPVNTLVIDAAGFGSTDATAAQAITETVTNMRAARVDVRIAELGAWPLEEWRELGLVELIGEANFHPTVAAAVAAAQAPPLPGAPTSDQ